MPRVPLCGAPGGEIVPVTATGGHGGSPSAPPQPSESPPTAQPRLYHRPRLLGQLGREPVEALVQTLALRRTRRLDVPLLGRHGVTGLQRRTSAERRRRVYSIHVIWEGTPSSNARELGELL